MNSFVHLRTAHDTWLAEDPSTDRLMHTAATSGLSRLLAYLPRARPDCAFLISEGTRRLQLAGAPRSPGIAPLGRSRIRDGLVSLNDPASTRWLCALPPDPGTGLGEVVADRSFIAAWEQFALVPAGSPAPDIRTRARRLDDLLAAPFTVDLLDRVQPGDGPLLEAVAQLAPSDALERFAAAVVASAAYCAVLADLFEADVYAHQGLGVLSAWLEGRAPAAVPTVPAPRGWASRLRRPARPEPGPAPVAPARRGRLGTALDAIADAGAAGEFVSLPYALNALARRRVEPRRDLCVIATARNEGLYILEWIAYHQALGVEEFFLYTNDNDDGSDVLLGALADAGVIYWTDNHVTVGGNAQHKAYAHALSLHPAVLDFRWALVIDLDEHLVINPAVFGSAIDFLRWHERGPTEAIALNWIFHGPAGEARWRDDFIGRRFPHPYGGVNEHIKTMLRPNRFVASQPHYPQKFLGATPVFTASNGRPHEKPQGYPDYSLSAVPTADFAWINHYFHKSTEEFLIKFSRNRGNWPTVKARSNALLPAGFVSQFMHAFDVTAPAAASPDQVAPDLDRRLAQLLKLPGVAKAWSAIKTYYERERRALPLLFQDAPGILEAGDAGAAFLATLAPPPASPRA